MKLLANVLIIFFPSAVHAEVLDKVTMPQTGLLILAVLFFFFLIVNKVGKAWLFWPYVTLLFILILGNADFIINDEMFHIASREYGGLGYMAYVYFELFVNILMLTASFALYFKQKRG
ncbi:hypothetical protein [Vreelandella populi]|uniref:hypothetical protein n=1 Tax=Vreelandella populi TaxID=2498858 RepID=UPI000F8E0BA1|nr:hypothetical protein [Halomonas populi]RUR53280.1 hypothetical protein ELY40_14810 [Halomonas populi]